MAKDSYNDELWNKQIEEIWELERNKEISKDTILDIIEVIIKKKDFIINNINSDKDAWITFKNTEESKNRMIQIGIKVYLGDNND